MTAPMLALTDHDGPAHAVHPGETTALCGAAVAGASETTFPGGLRHVCQECSRATAVAASSVPLRAIRGHKRPGGM
jgi:hypothetical protein